MLTCNFPKNYGAAFERFQRAAQGGVSKGASCVWKRADTNASNLPKGRFPFAKLTALTSAQQIRVAVGILQIFCASLIVFPPPRFCGSFFLTE